MEEEEQHEYIERVPVRIKTSRGAGVAGGLSNDLLAYYSPPSKLLSVLAER